MKQHGPWKIKSSEVKYKNPWIEVREDRVIHPDGKDGIFGIMTVRDGASILPIDADMNVYLTEEFHYGCGDSSIEVAAGGTEEGEGALQGAKRELREELGVIASQWTDLGYVNALTTLIHHQQRMFLAQELTFGNSQNDLNEPIRVRKMKLGEAIDLVMEGKIIDPTSCVLILKAAKYLGKL